MKTKNEKFFEILTKQQMMQMHKNIMFLDKNLFLDNLDKILKEIAKEEAKEQINEQKLIKEIQAKINKKYKLK